jgi:CheY-like chemotaxis protein
VASPAAAPRPESRPGPGGGILIVEDEAELVRALRINLRARQYEVRCAGTGREALAVAAIRPPDAIILDLGLPDIDGTEVIVELRRWYRAPIIVLSGRTSPGDKIGALDVGADDYVTKPFAMAELLARLRRAAPGRRRGGGRLPPGRDRPVAGRRLGTGVLRADQLSPLPHGPAAPQAGGLPGAAPPPADRTRHGLPLPALTVPAGRHHRGPGARIWDDLSLLVED